MKTIYFLSCARANAGGGIYRCSLSENGKVNSDGHLSCDKPMYGVKDGGYLHILLNNPFENSDTGGYFFVSEDFSECSEMTDTKGICPCHLCVDKNECFIVNYLSGNIVKNNFAVIEHEGKGKNPDRQEMPHTHCVNFSADKKYIFNTDLGTDCIFAYDRNLNEVAKIKLNPGYGVRHTVVSADGHTVYAINELVPSVSVLDFSNKKFSLLKTLPLPCENKNSTGAAIRLSKDEKYLYASVRDENVIFVIDIEKEIPEIIQKVKCGGDGPRDFDILDDRFLFCCNEKSDNITVFSVEGGKIKNQIQDLKISAPLCVII